MSWRGLPVERLDPGGGYGGGRAAAACLASSIMDEQRSEEVNQGAALAQAAAMRDGAWNTIFSPAGLQARSDKFT